MKTRMTTPKDWETFMLRRMSPRRCYLLCTSLIRACIDSFSPPDHETLIRACLLIEDKADVLNPTDRYMRMVASEAISKEIKFYGNFDAHHPKTSRVLYSVLFHRPTNSIPVVKNAVRRPSTFASLLSNSHGTLYEFQDHFRTVIVKDLASSVYHDRDQSLAPILADALEDAGFDDVCTLQRLRETSFLAYRGDWVLDACLGKAR